MKKLKRPEHCITAIGLATSVGHDHKTACASIRAGLSRPHLLGNYFLPSDTPFEDEDDGYVAGHPVIEENYDDWEDRVIRLLAMAFGDLMDHPGVQGISLEETPLCLCLAEKERHTVDEPGFISNLSEFLEIRFDETRFRLYQNGHTGMVLALSDAAASLEGGTASRMFIAGGDSLIGYHDLKRFNREGRLKSSLTPAGFMPGEGASVLLLETAAAANKRKAAPLCSVTSMAVHKSGGTEGGLARAVLGLLERQNGSPLTVDSVISDMDGSEDRASELALTHASILGRIAGGKNAVFPAKSVGNTGAASFGLSCCVATRAMARGYLRKGFDQDHTPGKALVLSSSDQGNHGAVILTEPPRPSQTHTKER